MVCSQRPHPRRCSTGQRAGLVRHVLLLFVAYDTCWLLMKHSPLHRAPTQLHGHLPTVPVTTAGVGILAAVDAAAADKPKKDKKKRKKKKKRKRSSSSSSEDDAPPKVDVARLRQERLAREHGERARQQAAVDALNGGVPPKGSKYHSTFGNAAHLAKKTRP